MVAVLVSTVSVNGSEAITVASAQSSFAGWARGFHPGAEELLSELRQQHRVACLSNSNEIHWRAFGEAVDQDWARSRGFGITGVPTFVAGGYGVVGAQPYETLEKLVRHALGSGEQTRG